MADPLATITDVEARIGRKLSTDEGIAVQALLRDASAAIRGYCGRPFGSVTRTVRKRARSGRVLLGAGITAVSAVANLDGDAVGFTFDGIDTVTVGAGVMRFDFDGLADQVLDITYTKDDGDVPDEIKAVAANVAARGMGVPADEGGIQQESVAGYSYTVGAAAAAGGVGLLPAERAVLDRYTSHVGVTRVVRS